MFPRQNNSAGALDWFCPGSASRRRRFVPKAFFPIFPGQKTLYTRRWALEACQVAHEVGGSPWKNIRKLSGRSVAVSRRNLGRSNLGLQRSCSVGETSLREGEIKANVITNDPLIERGSISINIFTNTISSQTLVHLLYPIFVSKPHIGTCGLLVVLITPCS